MIVLILRCHVTRCVGFCVSLMDNVWSFSKILAPLVFRLCTFDARAENLTFALWYASLSCSAVVVGCWLVVFALSGSRQRPNCSVVTFSWNPNFPTLPLLTAQRNLASGLSPLSLISLGLQYTPTSQLHSLHRRDPSQRLRLLYLVLRFEI